MIQALPQEHVPLHSMAGLQVINIFIINQHYYEHFANEAEKRLLYRKIYYKIFYKYILGKK